MKKSYSDLWTTTKSKYKDFLIRTLFEENMPSPSLTAFDSLLQKPCWPHTHLNQIYYVVKCHAIEFCKYFNAIKHVVYPLPLLTLMHSL